MKARLLRKKKVEELSNRVPENIAVYRGGKFDFLLVDASNFIETAHEIDENQLLAMTCNQYDHREVDNCIGIFGAMGALSPYLARDERLWVYLTHTYLLKYSRNRWPIPADDKTATKHIRKHFFVAGARGFERDNAASRLWWMAHLCSRIEGLSLKEALTSLLYQYDVRANIIERPTTSQSIHVFSAILRKLHESYNGDKSLLERDKFRSIMRKLNLLGGVKLLGALNEKQIGRALEIYISSL